MTRTRIGRIGYSAAAAAAVGLGLGAARVDGPSKGTPDIKSAGALAFGPDGLLFIGDSLGGAVFAVETGDRAAEAGAGPLKVEAVDEKVAAALGTSPRNVVINDMAVNPASGRVYLSVTRGKGGDGIPAIARVDRSGKVEAFDLKDVSFSRAELPKVPAPGASANGRGPDPRTEAITDLALVDGRLFVAGLSNEKFASRLLTLPYPFRDSAEGTSIEIFHGAHGRFETRSPVRTFAPTTIQGEPYLMAAYTCTPLVKVPFSALKPGAHYKATTIAELGNRNRPLDMVAYRKGGGDYLLMANSSRGMMKVDLGGAATAGSIVEPVKTETAGLPYETIKGVTNVVQLDKLDDAHAVVLIQDKAGSPTLESIPLP